MFRFFFLAVFSCLTAFAALAALPAKAEVAGSKTVQTNLLAAQV